MRCRTSQASRLAAFDLSGYIKWISIKVNISQIIQIYFTIL